MSAAREFQKALGSEVAKALACDVEFVPSQLLLRWRGEGADSLVSFSGSNKFSPFVSVAFYFGRRFESASQIERAIGDRSNQWHISHYSINLPLMMDMPYDGPHDWKVDIRNPPVTLVPEMARAIQGMAYPFFERFASVLVARDALLANDPWCVMADFMWSRMLSLDAALGELEHYEEWSEKLPDFYRAHSDQAFDQVRNVLAQGIQQTAARDRVKKRGA